MKTSLAAAAETLLAVQRAAAEDSRLPMGAAPLAGSHLHHSVAGALVVAMGAVDSHSRRWVVGAEDSRLLDGADAEEGRSTAERARRAVWVEVAMEGLAAVRARG